MMHMKAPTALREMVMRCDKTAIQISTDIGRKPNYVSSLLNRGSVPTVETFASIANACGARLYLEMPDETIQLDGWESLTSQNSLAGIAAAV